MCLTEVLTDGSCGLHTNRSVSVLKYELFTSWLQRVLEATFGTLSAEFRLRPIVRPTADRIQAYRLLSQHQSCGINDMRIVVDDGNCAEHHSHRILTRIKKTAERLG